ncbi:MAG: cytochrome c [Candidatus Hydrogenedentes bacterium]|nr:cytochrome c [Candidatus Hydrogenedentota bacterium]
MNSGWTKGLCLALVLLSAGCGRGFTSKRPPIHPVLDMDIQPKYKAQSANRFFYNQMTMQQPVSGTVAQGELYEDETVVSGKDADGQYLATNPLEATESLVARGANRYAIYCALCHTASGDGQGILYKRGGVPTTNLLDERIRTMSDGELFYVITNGLGLMPSYAYPLSVDDRWSIVAYVRQLQAGP